jgi:hypothetical protein
MHLKDKLGVYFLWLAFSGIESDRNSILEDRH